MAIQMIRKCKEHNLDVIGSSHDRPEKVFGFPTVNLPINQVDEKMEAECVRKEIEHVRY